jgi:hypothetical protein
MDYLRIAGVILSLMGTIILAIRVTKMLNILSLAAKVCDINFRIEAERAKGTPVPNIRMYGNTAHIEKMEKLGTTLLIFGFFLQIAGGVCNVLSLVQR